MTTIRTDAPVITLINVFEVAPENQRRLIDCLDRAAEEVMRHLPGFVSANIHRSVDGSKVVNYAQWQSHEAFEAMLENPVVHPHFEEIRAIATVRPSLYEVVSVHQAE